MTFLVYPYRKSGRSGWIAYDIDRDIPYRFHSDRHIIRWCCIMALRHGEMPRIEAGPLNAIDVAV